MEKTNKTKIGIFFIRGIIALSVLTVALIVLLLLRNSEAVCEFFAVTVARFWITLFGGLFANISFSIFELFIAIIVIAVVVLLVLMIVGLVKKQYRRVLSGALVVALFGVSFGVLYTVTAGMTYNREEVDIAIYSEKQSNELKYDDVKNIAEYFVNELNVVGARLPRKVDGSVDCPYTFAELNALLIEEYAKLDSAYYNSFTPTAKVIVNKSIMSQMHIVGVFFAPTGEANINPNEGDYRLPFSMAHEMAHGKGVMRENDANLVALNIVLRSNNDYLRYSGLMDAYGSLVSAVSYFPNTNAVCDELLSKISRFTAKEYDNYSKIWDEYTLLKDTGNFFNDIYLKFSGQGGTGSYDNPPSITQDPSGNVDDDGDPIIIVKNYSRIQRLCFELYYNYYNI